MTEERKNFIERTKQEFQPHYEEELSDSDAEEIIDNFTGFMNLLMKWDKKQREKESCKISYIENQKEKRK